MCERRKLDHAEALVEEARAAGLDVERFRLALRSHAITEAFGADLEATEALAGGGAATRRAGPRRARGGAPLPTAVFAGAGERRLVSGAAPYEAYREAAVACGARARRSVAARRRAGARALRPRHDARGRGAVRAARARAPAPSCGAWRRQWKVRAVPVLTGHLWEAGVGLDAQPRAKARLGRRPGRRPAGARPGAVGDLADHARARVAAAQDLERRGRVAAVDDARTSPVPMLNTSHISASGTSPQRWIRPKIGCGSSGASIVVADVGVQAQQVQQPVAR